MSPEEQYESKRRNFVDKVYLYFDFLTQKYGYEQPSHIESKQGNGTVTCDKIEFTNRARNRKISLVNAYHPYDYGFEIDFYDLTKANPLEHQQMVYYVLKEDQDIEQSYLPEAARVLEDKFKLHIEGKAWFPETENRSNNIYETIALRQPDGTMKTIVSNRKMNNVSFLKWLQRLFK